MVEFALAMPVALLLILGIMEMGWLFFSYASLATGARAAARYAAAVGTSAGGEPYYQDTSGICSEARRFAGLAGAQPSVAIHYDTGPGTTQSPAYACGSASTYSADLGTRVKVEVQATYRPLEPLVPLPNLVLSASAVRTIITGVPIG